MVRQVPLPPITIPYHSHDFRGFPIPDGPGVLSVFPEQLVWAAMTVGRASVADLLSHGVFSEYEIIYRIALLIANLTTIRGNRLSKSSAYLNLDPSEKGAVSYFLGLTMCKLFSEALLSTPWLLHLDLYRRQLNAISHAGSKQRPDLVGRDLHGEWIILESKGRTNLITPKDLAVAKQQTRHIRSIQGVTPRLRIAAVTHFSKGILTIDWQDPEEMNEDAFDLRTNDEQYLSFYYRLIYELLASRSTQAFGDYRTYTFDRLGLTVGLLEEVYQACSNQQLRLLRWPASERSMGRFQITRSFYAGGDGVIVGISNELSKKLRSDY